MIRGRKPKPKAAKQAGRDANRKPLEDDNPRPPAGPPECPPHVAAVPLARETWDWLCEALDEMGTLAACDTAIMALYCDTWAQYVEMQAELAEIRAKYKHSPLVFVEKRERHVGFIGKGEDKRQVKEERTTPYLSPWAQAEAMLKNQLHRYAVELGLSSTSRARLKVHPGKVAEDDKDRFFEGAIAGKVG